MSKQAVEIAAHFESVPRLEPQSIAVWFQGRTYSWGQLDAVANGIVDLLGSAGVPAHSAIGWLARNDPALVGALIGLLRGQYCVSPVNPHQPAVKAAEQLRALKMAATIGVAQDFTPEVRAALSETGALGLVLQVGAAIPVRLLDETAQLGKGPFRTLGEAIVIERLTSGTTGEPKRIQVPAETFAKAMQLGARSEKGRAKSELKVKRSAAILLNTFSHSGGMWGALLALDQARPIDLHERFTPEGWADAVERTKTRVSNLVPSMITMVLDAGIPREKLGSLMAIRCGTAALDPEVQRTFEETYGIPVLVEFGASEFMGGIAGWSLADHGEFGVSKRGSVGRLRPDIEIRITDVETGAQVGVGQVGIMHLKTPRAGPGWVKTTDLASLDADGFLYMHGRADEAINRGGFKVLPDKVAETLRLHPAIREVAILAVKDARLGQVPIAIVETTPGETAPTPDVVKAFVREQMPAYNVPVAVEFVAELPRTLSLKVDRPALRALLGHKYEF